MPKMTNAIMSNVVVTGRRMQGAGAGRRMEAVVDEGEFARLRRSAVARRLRGHREVVAGRRLADRRQLTLRQREGDVDRVQLIDRGEGDGVVRLDVVAGLEQD